MWVAFGRYKFNGAQITSSSVSNCLPHKSVYSHCGCASTLGIPEISLGESKTIGPNFYRELIIRPAGRSVGRHSQPPMLCGRWGPPWFWWWWVVKANAALKVSFSIAHYSSAIVMLIRAEGGYYTSDKNDFSLLIINEINILELANKSIIDIMCLFRWLIRLGRHPQPPLQTPQTFFPSRIFLAPSTWLTQTLTSFRRGVFGPILYYIL